MARLKELDLIDALHEAVLQKQKPILGICLGMEVMAKRSDEGNAAGLGWVDGEIVRFNITDTSQYKIPHMGWNQVSIRKVGLLLTGIPDLSEFYFAHSYYLKINDPADLLAETEYEITFASAIERNNIFGVQYHPEKSHDVGARLMKNFLDI
jgi:glutamine amidotransferase